MGYVTTAEESMAFGRGWQLERTDDEPVYRPGFLL
jgi:hypothetical protein